MASVSLKLLSTSQSLLNMTGSSVSVSTAAYTALSNGPVLSNAGTVFTWALSSDDLPINPFSKSFSAIGPGLSILADMSLNLLLKILEEFFTILASEMRGRSAIT